MNSLLRGEKNNTDSAEAFRSEAFTFLKDKHEHVTPGSFRQILNVSSVDPFV